MVDRHLFIGDVQGCREELEQLLEKARFDPASDRIVCVGDLVNRGPDSAGALRVLRKVGARTVLGNHDLHLLRVAEGTRDLRRGDTLTDVLEAKDGDQLLDWLRKQPFARKEAGCLVVHAGLNPRWKKPLAALRGLDPLVPHPDTAFATRVRYCDENGNRPDSDHTAPGKPYAPWFTFRRSSSPTIVFGHWAARGLVVEKGLRGLDTGCVWGGKLTAWIEEEDRLVQVKARRAYQSPSRS